MSPPPVTITAVDMTINDCQYRWRTSYRNDSDAPLNNLVVGGKQKAPHYNTFHAAGAMVASSISPGQELTKTVGWTRDIRATEFYVFVAKSETNELASQPYSIPALSASIGEINFAPPSRKTAITGVRRSTTPPPFPFAAALPSYISDCPTAVWQWGQ